MYPSLVVEQLTHETLRVGELQAVFLGYTLPLLPRLAQQLGPRLIQVILQRFAHIVVETDGGIGGHEFLALGLHRQDTADDHRTARIDGQVLGLEDFGEMLGHALPDAVVLPFAHRGEFAQTLDGGGIESLHLGKHLLAFGREFPVMVGRAEGLQRLLVVVLADEPARAVPAIMAQVEWLVALRCRGQRFIGQLPVIVHIVTSRQKHIRCNLLAGCFP